VGERGNGGAVGEPDGGEDGDAEREDDDEEGGLTGGEAGVTEAQPAKEKRQHGAA
jgi:hypothetical protein